MVKTIFLSLCFLAMFSSCNNTDKIVPIWSEEIPNYRKIIEKEIKEDDDISWIESVNEPSLEIFLPSKIKATGQAIIICPGGGYKGLSYNWEGINTAKWLNSKGIAAFVLKYRLPQSKSVIIGHKAPLQDAQRALRLVRYNSEKWNISNNKIGIMGFSAGGHLASTLGVHYDKEIYKPQDSMDNVSAKPDFMVLVYPVITMDSTYGHTGSRKRLLGENPSEELVDYFSANLHVTKNTPPTYLLHTSDDNSVPVINSILLYQALQKNKVYSEMHIFPKGGHGFGLAKDIKHLQIWTNCLSGWLESLE